MRCAVCPGVHVVPRGGQGDQETIDHRVSEVRELRDPAADQGGEGLSGGSVATRPLVTPNESSRFTA